jgi:hypothetical protein
MHEKVFKFAELLRERERERERERDSEREILRERARDRAVPPALSPMRAMGTPDCMTPIAVSAAAWIDGNAHTAAATAAGWRAVGRRQEDGVVGWEANFHSLTH